MPKHIRNRFLVLALLILAAVICAAPSFVMDPPSWWRRIWPAQGMRLGLDLRGGMHLILKVDIQQAAKHYLELSVADLRETLRNADVTAQPAESTDTGHIRLRLLDAGGMPLVKRVIKEEFPSLEWVVEQNGYINLALKDNERKAIENNAVDQCLETIRNRIDQFGVEEPVIVRQGDDEIVLQLAGIREPERALELIGRTAQLSFKTVVQTPAVDFTRHLETAVQSGRLKRNFSHQELNQVLKNAIPSGTELYIERKTDGDTKQVHTFPVLLKQATLMTGEAIKTARVEIGGQFSEPHVSITFNPSGAKRFEKITREYVGHQLAIVLDDIVQSAPVIQEPITGGKAQITGSFTTEEAHDLAIVLRAGALPAPVAIVQNLTVGPSLGKDSIHNGLASTLLGALLVVLFMIVYYRLSGLIANFALLLNLIFMLAALSLFRATLTLPGIAGIVLSIGMAVDSNVLIFERMRDELSLGRPVYSSVQSGFSKALWTIIDAHVTTLITALALFLFGTGPIKGFAVTLSIGVLFNLFTALYGTRLIYDYLHFKRRLKPFHFLHILRKPAIDFIRLHKAAFVVSGAFVALGLFAGLQIQQGKANLGVELAGGAMFQFKAEKDFKLDQIRSALSQNNMSDYELQEAPGEKVLMVRVKKTEQSSVSAADQVAAVLNQHLPENRFVIENKAEIGASVSQDLKRAALIAITISLAGIIAYLAWRFDHRFGVAAAMATFHDVLTVLGIFYLLNKEITLLVITALLTLAGYSLTDTVVVFDRIRENLKAGRPQSLREVINQSINQVLSRTVITSGTVVLVLVALMAMGGALLHDFALALLIGVIVGAYSSIFVASPIVYIWENLSNKNRNGGKKK